MKAKYPDKNHYEPFALPRVSIIVPTYNASGLIEQTLDSIFKQKYFDYEVLVVDGESTDHTLDLVKSYIHPQLHLFSVAVSNPYEMMNLGIMRANGLYVQILFPGDRYLVTKALQIAMEFALEHHRPHLIYAASINRKEAEMELEYHSFSNDLLQNGKEPSSLQSCWIRRDVFQKVGRFSAQYPNKASYDFFCRFSLYKELSVQSMRRVLLEEIDTYHPSMNQLSVFWETIKILYNVYGLRAVLRWFFRGSWLGK